MNTQILLASPKDAAIIHELAMVIWPQTYRAILTQEQIDFMLAKSYTTEAIAAAMANGQYFYLLYLADQPKGFMALQVKEENNKLVRIEKLYLDQTVQGKGLGKVFIDFAKQKALAAGQLGLELNVNRANLAYHFYLKQGFVVSQQVDIPYFGYVLDDYIMQFLF